MKWEKKAPNIWVAFIKKERESLSGKKFNVTEAVRITKESNGYRIDFAGHIAGAWLPWEPIETTPFGTIALAKKAVSAYAKRKI